MKTGDMVKRDGHQIGLFNIRVGRVDGGQQQPGEAFVAQHHALGHSGGAGGEHDYRGVIIVRLREVKLIGHGAGNQIVIADPSICGRPVQYHYPIGGHPFVGRDQWQVSLSDEQHAGLGDIQHYFQLLGLGPKVDGNVDSVQLGGGEVEFDAMWRVDLHHGYPVAGGHAPVRQGVGQFIYLLLKFGEGGGFAVEVHDWAIRDDGGGNHQKF